MSESAKTIWNQDQVSTTVLWSGLDLERGKINSFLAFLENSLVWYVKSCLQVTTTRTFLWGLPQLLEQGLRS
jgi:hypothetical protein